MDEEGALKILADRTAGAVTALEDQMRVLLGAIIGAGVEPEVITGLLGQMRGPGLESEAGTAYERVMGPFRAAVDSFAAERAAARAEAGVGEVA